MLVALLCAPPCLVLLFYKLLKQLYFLITKLLVLYEVVFDSNKSLCLDGAMVELC